MEPKRKRLLWQVPFLTLLVIGTVLIIRQQHNAPYQHDEGFIFGTTYSITYQWDKDLHEVLRAKMLQVDRALSMFNEESVITRVNVGDGLVPDDETGRMFLDVFRLGMEVSRETDGAFDMTVAPLVNAWGFGFKSGALPTDREVDSLLRFVGYGKVRFEAGSQGKVTGTGADKVKGTGADKVKGMVAGRVVKEDVRTMLDCSAIAKGYGADVVAGVLRERGVRNYMVEIGGEVVTRGVSAKRVPWRIGVTRPVDDSLRTGQELQTVLNITDKAMATSGNYRNFYYRGGRKYAHTIDPKSGRPVQHSILSATVLCDECARADAYATALMVMGLEGARGLLERHPELMAYVIYDDGGGRHGVWFSPSLKDKMEQ